MATLSKFIKMIVLCGILGALAYQVQHYCLNELLNEFNIRRNWHLATALAATHDVWPLGAVLGGLTGSALAAIRMHEPQAAARLCIAGGSLVAACIIDAVVLLCWWLNGKPSYGFFWTTTETLLGLIPAVAFGLLWSLLLVLHGWQVQRRPTLLQHGAAPARLNPTHALKNAS